MNIAINILAICLMFFAVSSNSPACAGILFEDNFNNGASSAWGNERGAWYAVCCK